MVIFISFDISTLSSGLNSLAAVCLEDFVKPIIVSRSYDLSEKKLTQLSKIIGKKYLATIISKEGFGKITCRFKPTRNFF